MKFAIAYRYAKDQKGIRNRLYIPEELKLIFDELNVTLIPIVSSVGIDELVEMCDALILPGSYADTHPKYYHERVIEGKEYDVDEYRFDSLIMSKFVEQHKPILGICGGHQEINVFFGGTLKQRILKHNSGDLHRVIVSDNTFLKEIYAESKLMVNSFHNQAVKDVAPGFKVSAISSDGVVEAIEKDNIIGVQWHPEIMNDLEFFKKFISEFFSEIQ